jgi:diguanylate cyclase (GGDEF)-like protein
MRAAGLFARQGKCGVPPWQATIERAGAALARYSQRAGQLVERHIAEAALVAARQEAEREAAEAILAKAELEQANAALKEEVAVHSRTQSRLSYLASHDPLTALPNRTLFTERLSEAIEVARSQSRKLALMYVDLDNFKYVNDTLGHAAGDALLKHVSARLRSELRSGEVAARMGGDEFAILQLSVDYPGQSRVLAERLIAKISQPFEIEDKQVFVGASIGITLFPDDADAVDVLHRNADLAMYRAKRDGRNRCHFFDGSLNEETQRRALLEQALREPSLISQMRLVFQPQVDMRSGRVTGLEALLRWQHPQLGLMLPGDFIPVSERSGIIADIGTWVLHESCRYAARWCHGGLQPLTVSVNVSTGQFRDNNIPRLVAQALEQSGLAPGQLELEITETGIMHDVHVAAETLVALHHMGVGLAIDDFGTGYSSLSYLRRLPVDRIKIDQSFVADAPVSEDARAIVTSIVNLAHSLRLRVVAEGVETAAQAQFVRQSGSDFAQGYYYGAPVDPDALPAVLLREGAIVPAQ